MFGLICLLLVSHLATAETVWWRICGADPHHRKLLELTLDQTLPRVARRLPGPVNATAADYLIDEDRVAAAEEAIAMFNPLFTSVRRAGDDPATWIELDWLDEPRPADEVAAYSLLNRAGASLAALDALHAAMVSSEPFANALRRLARDLFARLAAVTRPEFDLYILTHEAIVGAAATSVIANDPRLLDVYLDVVRRSLSAAPRTRDELDPHHVAFRDAKGVVDKIDLNHAGVTGAPFYRFDPPDRAERRMQTLPFGSAFLALAAPGAEATRERVIETVRALYAPVAEQVAAQNAYALLEDFTGTLKRADPSVVRGLWDASKLRTLPRGLVERLNVTTGGTTKDTRRLVKMRAKVVRDRARPILGSANLHHFITRLSDAGRHVNEVWPEDAAATLRYYQNAIFIFRHLIERDPPKFGTLSVLRDGALRLIENMSLDLPPTSTDPAVLALHADAAALRREIRGRKVRSCEGPLAK